MTANTTISATAITISTTPQIGSAPLLVRQSTNRSRLVGMVARIIAGITGAVLGVALGLVSAGFDATYLLLAVGAVTIGVGWLIAFITGPTGTSSAVMSDHH